ncbi:hypothetical protein LCGC14_2007230 [marine sediment metagenome]|uniref:Uncharacterized protein n=1 Tax=marine sediment metagenome TaxID=412755 RepID=A0A0F9HYF8_9ZZZZ
MANKKDEVKTKVHAMSFDKHLFEALEDWRWANRMTRSGAVNFILEKFLSSLKNEKDSKQQEFILKN